MGRAVLLAVALLPGLAHGQTPAAGSLAGLEVTLRVERPLRLVRWAFPGGETGPVALDGAVEVTLANRGGQPLALRDLWEHGLVFVAADLDTLAVLVHPCKCVKDALEPRAAVLTLVPGETRRLSFADFGCGGGPWQPPPPGRYRLEYRVLPAPAETPVAADSSPAALVPRCRAELTSPATWANAARSPAVEVVLGEPVTVAIDVGI